MLARRDATQRGHLLLIRILDKKYFAYHVNPYVNVFDLPAIPNEFPFAQARYCGAAGQASTSTLMSSANGIFPRERCCCSQRIGPRLIDRCPAICRLSRPLTIARTSSSQRPAHLNCPAISRHGMRSGARSFLAPPIRRLTFGCGTAIVCLRQDQGLRAELRSPMSCQRRLWL